MTDECRVNRPVLDKIGDLSLNDNGDKKKINKIFVQHENLKRQLDRQDGVRLTTLEKLSEDDSNESNVLSQLNGPLSGAETPMTVLRVGGSTSEIPLPKVIIFDLGKLT